MSGKPEEFCSHQHRMSPNDATGHDISRQMLLQELLASKLPPKNAPKIHKVRTEAETVSSSALLVCGDSRSNRKRGTKTFSRNVRVKWGKSSQQHRGAGKLFSLLGGDRLLRIRLCLLSVRLGDCWQAVEATVTKVGSRALPDSSAAANKSSARAPSNQQHRDAGGNKTTHRQRTYRHVFSTDLNGSIHQMKESAFQQISLKQLVHSHWHNWYACLCAKYVFWNFKLCLIDLYTVITPILTKAGTSFEMEADIPVCFRAFEILKAQRQAACDWMAYSCHKWLSTQCSTPLKSQLHSCSTLKWASLCLCKTFLTSRRKAFLGIGQWQ